MSKSVIKIEDVSKMYRLGELSTGTLYQDLHRTWARLKGKSDPFAQVGVTNDREQKGGEYVWALKDINFEVQEGEILGIIGRNGAGKSTLLKLLSRITAPTTGQIRAKGRIASLLEVGTGFHPELTGRENIYLNGAIMGMTKREITNQLEEIIEFSGCTKYIDTPVKRYSSGMMVRLGFSVAAHLECEILIVDEVLAVGDIEFQKKCLNKMEGVAEAGRTVLFVSHQLQAIESFCSRVLLIKHGKMDFDGSTSEALNLYTAVKTDSGEDKVSLCNVVRSGGNQKAIKEAWIQDSTDRFTREIRTGEDIKIYFRFEADHELVNPGYGLSINTRQGVRLSTYGNYVEESDVLQSTKSGVVCFSVTRINLLAGYYVLNFGLSERRNDSIDYIESALELKVLPSDIYGTGRSYEPSQGYFSMDISLTLSIISGGNEK